MEKNLRGTVRGMCERLNSVGEKGDKLDKHDQQNTKTVRNAVRDPSHISSTVKGRKVGVFGIQYLLSVVDVGPRLKESPLL